MNAARRGPPPSSWALAVLYIGANVPFVFKYVSRAGASGAAASFAYVVVAAALWFLAPAVARGIARRDPRGRAYWAMAVLSALALAAIMSRFDPAGIRVTRAPAIEAWLDRLLSGQFPYAADARPSSFPAWFLMALPFRLAGDVGWIQIAGFLGFAALCRDPARADASRAWAAMALLLASPLFLYEVATRSELFANTTLAVAVLAALEPPRTGWGGRIVAGLAAGIALSTRGIVGLAYAVFFPWRFRHEWRVGAVTALAAAVAFSATLLPFVLWDAPRFLRDGPFAIQLSYAPAWLVAALGGAGVVLGATSPSARRTWFAIAALLYAAIASVFLYSVVTEGWTNVLVGDGFDISYFAFGQTVLLFWLARFATASPSADRSC